MGDAGGPQGVGQGVELLVLQLLDAVGHLVAVGVERLGCLVVGLALDDVEDVLDDALVHRRDQQLRALPPVGHPGLAQPLGDGLALEVAPVLEVVGDRLAAEPLVDGLVDGLVVTVEVGVGDRP